eukprot:TRINITY_DN10632_c0_g1_i1.p1 TRINITY_DN10632_c0_g1~~TRINITY_DN10632_c0_g1_i1.p1  ORF type:complete len:388 (-),score=24.76 TRINITY_DN10632_c0_g1_i1:78-1241(-)
MDTANEDILTLIIKQVLSNNLTDFTNISCINQTWNILTRQIAPIKTFIPFTRYDQNQVHFQLFILLLNGQLLHHQYTFEQFPNEFNSMGTGADRVDSVYIDGENVIIGIYQFSCNHDYLYIRCSSFKVYQYDVIIGNIVEMKFMLGYTPQFILRMSPRLPTSMYFMTNMKKKLCVTYEHEIQNNSYSNNPHVVFKRCFDQYVRLPSVNFRNIPRFVHVRTVDSSVFMLRGTMEKYLFKGTDFISCAFAYKNKCTTFGAVILYATDRKVYRNEYIELLSIEDEDVSIKKLEGGFVLCSNNVLYSCYREHQQFSTFNKNYKFTKCTQPFRNVTNLIFNDLLGECAIISNSTIFPLRPSFILEQLNNISISRFVVPIANEYICANRDNNT